jgi:hypothetical protein
VRLLKVFLELSRRQRFDLVEFIERLAIDPNLVVEAVIRVVLMSGSLWFNGRRARSLANSTKTLFRKCGNSQFKLEDEDHG